MRAAGHPYQVLSSTEVDILPANVLRIVAKSACKWNMACPWPVWKPSADGQAEAFLSSCNRGESERTAGWHGGRPGYRRGDGAGSAPVDTALRATVG